MYKVFYYLCLLWGFSRKIETVLFLTKVLDNDLETVWPEKNKAGETI